MIGFAACAEGRGRKPALCITVIKYPTASNVKFAAGGFDVALGAPAVERSSAVPVGVNRACPIRVHGEGQLEQVTQRVSQPPVGQLATRALERRNLLDAATASDDDTKAHVERLEGLVDSARLPEGDELIADIERFLREGGTSDDDEGDGGSRLH